MRFIDRLVGSSDPVRMTLGEYSQQLNQFAFGGIGYGFGGVSPVVQQSMPGQKTEPAPNNFVGLAQHAFASNGVVFACMLVRMLLFSSVRFQFQNLRNGKPSDTFGNASLRLLEEPWVGGTTQDLIARMTQHADLGGNAYVAKIGGELVVMRPDWVDIIVEERMVRGGRVEVGGGQVGWRKVGYLYTEGGPGSGNDSVAFLADEVVHFAPIPDPLASYRGMSWLTPIIREIQADQAMTTHQSRFFDNAATVNMVIKHAPGADREAVKKWAEEVDSKHRGAANAYKNLNLYPGADVTVVGSNLKDIDFKNVRGGGETRIAAAAGVPPVIVGLSEGLAAATYSNYGQARRRLADGTAHPYWQNLAGSLQRIVPPPNSGARLWYDATDVPFLREDERDAADIQQVRAATVASLIASGFTPESAVAAVEANDFIGLLKHTGLTSVQLQKPGSKDAGQGGTGNADTGNN